MSNNSPFQDILEQIEHKWKSTILTTTRGVFPFSEHDLGIFSRLFLLNFCQQDQIESFLKDNLLEHFPIRITFNLYDVADEDLAGYLDHYFFTCRDFLQKWCKSEEARSQLLSKMELYWPKEENPDRKSIITYLGKTRSKVNTSIEPMFQKIIRTFLDQVSSQLEPTTFLNVRAFLLFQTQKESFTVVRKCNHYGGEQFSRDQKDAKNPPFASVFFLTPPSPVMSELSTRWRGGDKREKMNALVIAAWQWNLCVMAQLQCFRPSLMFFEQLRRKMDLTLDGFCTAVANQAPNSFAYLSPCYHIRLDRYFTKCVGASFETKYLKKHEHIFLMPPFHESQCLKAIRFALEFIRFCETGWMILVLPRAKRLWQTIKETLPHGSWRCIEVTHFPLFSFVQTVERHSLNFFLIMTQATQMIECEERMVMLKRLISEETK